MLLKLPDILTADELRAVRALLDAAAWDDGRSTAGEQAAAVKRNQQLPPQDEAARQARALVLRALDRSALLFSAALPRRVLPPMFNRYAGASNRYGDHVDQAIRQLGDGGERLRTDLSCTLFLSAPDDYDGGELVIREPGGEQRHKLPAGHLLLYPSTSVHRVEPVTRGARLAAVFWIESMVRSAEQRQLLFELDLNVVKLREQQGESGVAVGLTATYHNLLRMWATA